MLIPESKDVQALSAQLLDSVSMTNWFSFSSVTHTSSAPSELHVPAAVVWLNDSVVIM